MKFLFFLLQGSKFGELLDIATDRYFLAHEICITLNFFHVTYLPLDPAYAPIKMYKLHLDNSN